MTADRFEFAQYEKTLTKEVEAEDLGAPTHDPAAHLYPNGNALYFDADGDQIPEMQGLGFCGLHKFVKKYPEGLVFWSIWGHGEAPIAKSSIPWLLRHIRRRPAAAPARKLSSLKCHRCNRIMRFSEWAYIVGGNTQDRMLVKTIIPSSSIRFLCAKCRGVK